MADAGTASFYEVRCQHCDASFPPEARRCLHCGRRLGGGLLRGAHAAPPAQAPILAEGTRSEPGDWTSGRAHRPGPLDAEEGQEELEGPRSSGLLWIATAALAVIGSALRVCQGG